jgi:hypothetical protein
VIAAGRANVQRRKTGRLVTRPGRLILAGDVDDGRIRIKALRPVRELRPSELALKIFRLPRSISRDFYISP